MSSKTRRCPPPPPTHPPPPAQTAGHGSRHHRTGCCITCLAAEGWSRRREFFFAFSSFFCWEFYSDPEEPAGRRRGARANLTIIIYYTLLSHNQYFNIQWQGCRNETTSNLFKFDHSWGCKWLLFVLGLIKVWLLYTIIIWLMTWFMIVIYK